MCVCLYVCVYVCVCVFVCVCVCVCARERERERERERKREREKERERERECVCPCECVRERNALHKTTTINLMNNRWRIQSKTYYLFVTREITHTAKRKSRRHIHRNQTLVYNEIFGSTMHLRARFRYSRV